MYVLIAGLFVIGLFGIFGKRHILKKILGLVIVEHAINLFLISVGYRDGGIPPIVTHADTADLAAFARTSVDPLPQALVLTSIVIGLGVVMLLVALSLRLQERCGTLDSNRMNQLRG